MADFPNSVVTFTTKQNRTGVVYDETKTKVVFAEDFNLERDEIVAIEEVLLNENNDLNCPQTIEVELVPAQILDLYDHPIIIIPAPGEGKFIEVLNVTTRLRFNTIAYSVAGTVYLKIEGQNTMFKVNGLNGSANNISSCVREVCTIEQNKALILGSTLSDPTSGDGNFFVYVTYRIITV